MFSHCKKFYRLLSVLVTIALCIGMTSCGSDDESSEKGLMGWYTDLTDVARESDFSEINTAINNKEQLSSYYYGGERHTYIASYDLFVNSSTGYFNDTSSYLGRLRFKIKNPINVVRILNDNTLMTYVGFLYVAGKIQMLMFYIGFMPALYSGIWHIRGHRLIRRMLGLTINLL